jgi:hypothetical protein
VQRALLVVAALLLAGIALLVEVAERGEDSGPGARASVVGASPNGVYPALQPAGSIGVAGDGPRDSGAGVYPALTASGRLVVPDRAAVRRAARWLATRRGRAAFAVLDDHGALSGLHPRARFLSASLTKAMILVAFLRRANATRDQPSPAELLSLGYMIRLSDNASADSIFRRVGPAGLREVARRSGMRDFSVGADWANATVTPADQARLFLSLDGLVPPRFLPLARELLETVSPLHSWGIPRAARPRWRTFFKGGWRPEAGAEVVHQAALVESGARRLGIAVMTGEDPSMLYGERTIEGVARRLLEGSESTTVPVGSAYVPGRLFPIVELDRFRAPDPPPLEPLGATGK